MADPSVGLVGSAAPRSPGGASGIRPGMVDAHDLGPALEAPLLEACHGRLKNLRWFRTDWQIGGAATAYASCNIPGHSEAEVVVKLPVNPRELRILTTLCDTDAPTPRIAMHGTEIGGYDFAWAVMERLPGNPLSAKLHRDVFQHLVDSAARFHAELQARLPIEAPPEPPKWESLLERGREALKANMSMPHAQEWLHAVKHVHKALPHLLSAWSRRSISTWCHGDLHPGNCMERPAQSPWGPDGYILLDFAEVHCGHWIEDAVYLERQFWGRPQILDGVKPVSLLAKARREMGLETSDDYGTLANIRRVLMAATTPAFLEREGHPAYLNAALEIIDKTLPQLARVA